MIGSLKIYSNIFTRLFHSKLIGYESYPINFLYGKFHGSTNHETSENISIYFSERKGKICIEIRRFFSSVLINNYGKIEKLTVKYYICIKININKLLK